MPYLIKGFYIKKLTCIAKFAMTIHLLCDAICLKRTQILHIGLKYYKWSIESPLTKSYCFSRFVYEKFRIKQEL